MMQLRFYSYWPSALSVFEAVVGSRAKATCCMRTSPWLCLRIPLKPHERETRRKLRLKVTQAKGFQAPPRPRTKIQCGSQV